MKATELIKQLQQIVDENKQDFEVNVNIPDVRFESEFGDFKEILEDTITPLESIKHIGDNIILTTVGLIKLI